MLTEQEGAFFAPFPQRHDSYKARRSLDPLLLTARLRDLMEKVRVFRFFFPHTLPRPFHDIAAVSRGGS